MALTSPPLSAELRERVIRLALASAHAQTIPPVIADLVAGFPRFSMSRWIIAAAVLTVGLSIALASTIRLVDPLPEQSPSQPPVKRESDEPTPAGQVKNETPIDPLPAGVVTRFGSPRLQDFTISKSACFSPDGKLFATSGPNNPLSHVAVVDDRCVVAEKASTHGALPARDSRSRADAAASVST